VFVCGGVGAVGTAENARENIRGKLRGGRVVSEKAKCVPRKTGREPAKLAKHAGGRRNGGFGVRWEEGKLQ